MAFFDNQVRRIAASVGTLGKALGGASGGYVAAHREIVELLRQRSRPYLFSNSLAPSICAATLKVLELLASEEGAALRARAREKAFLTRNSEENN